MPRPSRPWFRFYVETTRDIKIRQLTPTHRWLWVAILSAVRESPISGHLMLSQSVAMSELMLSDYGAVRVQDVRSGLRSLQALGLIEKSAQYDCWMVPRWSERQFESDDSTIRTRKHRSNDDGRNGVGNEVGTDQIQRQNTDTETTKKQGVPTNFEITDQLKKWAAEKGHTAVSLDAETQNFLDYHAAKGTKFTDWSRAWQTWIRRADGWAKERRPSQPTSSQVARGADPLPHDDDDGELVILPPQTAHA